MESDSALNVYSEAKSEYMFQLCSYLTPAYFSFYLDLLERAKVDTAAEPKRHLWQFQNLLAEIEDWNMERVNREVTGILTRANCDFLEDLLTAVFIAHTKVLTAIRLNSKQKKVQITVPKIDHFLLKVFCETSRLLWQSAYLFRENVNGMEKQQNYRQVQGIIENGVRTAIRAMVPVKSLLKDCVHGEPDEDSDEEAETVQKESEPDTEVVPEPVAVPEPESVPEVEHRDNEAIEAFAEESSAEVKTISGHMEQLTTETASAPASMTVPLDSEAPKNELIPPPSPSLPSPSLPSPLPPSNLIVVDEAPQVAFSEYETIFDTENSDGNYIQPTQFHEAESYEEPSLEILDDVGVPLESEDLDTIDADTVGVDSSKGIDFEELM